MNLDALITKVSKHLEENEFREALDLLDSAAAGNLSLKGNLLEFRRRYNKLAEDKRMGLVDTETLNQEERRIAQGLQAIMRELQEEDGLPAHGETSDEQASEGGRKRFPNLRALQLEAEGLLGKNKVLELFSLLSRNVRYDSNVRDKLVQLNNRWSRTKEDESMKGTLSRSEAETEYNQVTYGLGDLIREITQEDMGEGGDLDDPLDAEAAKFSANFPVTSLYRVNCDRRKPVKRFFRSFGNYVDSHKHYQFYFLPSDKHQQPGSFSERMVYELVQKELGGDRDSLFYPRRSEDDRVLMEALPLGSRLSRHQEEFKQRVSILLRNFGQSDTSFEDYLETDLLAKLKYVVFAFRIDASDWDEHPDVPEYLEWIIDTFSKPRESVPTFLFFFVVVIDKAHQSEAMRRANKEVFEELLELCEKRAELVTLLEPLLPVSLDDFKEWIDKFEVLDVQSKVEERILELLEKRLSKEEKAWYEQHQEFYMERIEQFTEKVYNHLKNT